MTPEDDDRILRAAFAELRREEEARMPSFEAAVRRGRTRPSPAFLLIRPLAVASAVALAVLGVWLGTRAPEPRPSTPLPSLSEWQSPTDFLLATPGRDLLGSPTWGRSVLDLGTPSLASDLERRSPS